MESRLSNVAEGLIIVVDDARPPYTHDSRYFEITRGPRVPGVLNDVHGV